MSKSVLFHIPKPVVTESAYGSKIRPYRLIQAFESIGCNIEVISGTSVRRKKKIIEILKEINQGRKFDLFYSESSNAPIPVSDNHHLPLTPFIDYIFFREVRKCGIPSGFFYRDVFWKFPVFKKRLSFPKRLLSLPLYVADWKIYQKYFNHLFLPSMLMSKYLHTPWRNDSMSALPPGCVIHNCSEKGQRKKLVCFYVGGIDPPVYDLKKMLQQFSNLEQINLILCCRAHEWHKYRSYYHLGSQNKNIDVIHAEGKDLEKYYCQADLFIIAWQGDPYLEFAMPVKLFEAMGFGLPVIITGGSEASKFVSSHDIGWVLENINDLSGLLKNLDSNRDEIERKRQNVKIVRENHTWEKRAREIISNLAE